MSSVLYSRNSYVYTVTVNSEQCTSAVQCRRSPCNVRDSTPLLHFGPAGNATPPPPSESTAVALQYTAVLHALQLLLYLSVSCVSRQFGAPEFGEGPASLSPVVLDARDLSLDS